MNPVVVVGAGIAGVATARVLAAAEVPFVLLDRGRRVGGRMASRTTDGRVVDTGASYFTVSEPEFEAVVSDWHRRGLARPWTDVFVAGREGDFSDKPGPMRWAAPGGLRTLVEDLVTGLDVQQRVVHTVDPGLVVDGRPAAAVVLAMPDPQARRLLDPAYAVEIEALDDPFEPVLALTARWSERRWNFDGAFVADDPIITWIADDGRRRGDDAPVLVAHSTGEFAAQHLDAPDDALPRMTLAVRDAVGLDAEPESARIHRWTFARPTGQRREPFFLGDALVGLCGDAWSEKPRVESAYRSGTALGHALVSRLT